MQRTNRKLDFYTVILSVLVLASVIMRSIASVLYLDFEYGYYTAHTLINTAGWVIGIGCAFLFTYLLLPDDTRYHEDFTTAETYIPTALVGASLIFFAYGMFSSGIEAPPGIFSDSESILCLLCAVCALLSVAYFFLNSFIKDLKSDIRAATSFVAIIFFCIYPTYLYFNGDLPINAPTKITDQLAYLASAIFFLYESRISLGREKWRAYITFGMIASLLCAYSSIPSLVVYFRAGNVISNSIYESVLTFTLFIFISARLLLIRELKEECKCDLALAVEKHFEARQAELGEDILNLSLQNEPTQLELELEIKDSDSKKADNDNLENQSPVAEEASEDNSADSTAQYSDTEAEAEIINEEKTTDENELIEAPVAISIFDIISEEDNYAKEDGENSEENSGN